MGQVGWIIDLTRCIGCHTCTVSCQAELNTLELQTGKADLAYRHVVEVRGGQYPNPFMVFVTMSCNHCEKPACMPACPVNAITKRKEDGIVLFDQDLCIGCGYCAAACPYGAPRFNVNTNKYEKCTFCIHRTSKGLEPACVPTCVGGALKFVRDGEAGDWGEIPSNFADPELTRPVVRFIR